MARRARRVPMLRHERLASALDRLPHVLGQPVFSIVTSKPESEAVSTYPPGQRFGQQFRLLGYEMSKLRRGLSC